jgi:hypothetical protein
MVAIKTSDYALRKAIIEANAMVSDNKAAEGQAGHNLCTKCCVQTGSHFKEWGDANSPALEKGRSLS